MEDLKQRLIEHIADLLNDEHFELDMTLLGLIDSEPSEKSDLHLLMADASFKAFCTYFNKKDETEQCNMHVVGRTEGELCGKPNCDRQKLNHSHLCHYHWDIANS